MGPRSLTTSDRRGGGQEASACLSTRAPGRPASALRSSTASPNPPEARGPELSRPLPPFCYISGLEKLY